MEKDCFNCEYIHLYSTDEPCDKCFDSSFWSEATDPVDLNKDCGTCKHEDLLIQVSPCCNCDGFDEWTKKTAQMDLFLRDCDTCRHERLALSQVPCNKCEGIDGGMGFTKWEPVPDDDDSEVEPEYESLYGILMEALKQSQNLKGRERHAQEGEDFTDQIICEVGRRVGLGYPLGQAIKKAIESQRLGGERGVRELLGSIVYLSSAVILMREAIKNG